MSQCKRDGCEEPVVYNRRWGNKCYCESRGHAYADKRDAALAARAKMPDCASGLSPSCKGKVRAQRYARGETVCRFCEDAARELQKQYECEQREHKLEETKLRDLDNAETVHELREWIKEYML